MESTSGSLANQDADINSDPPELSADRTLRQFWRLLVHQWKTNLLVPIARKHGATGFICLFGFLVFTRLFSEGAIRSIPPDAWMITSFRIGMAIVAWMIWLGQIAIWVKIVAHTWNKLTETNDLRQLPFTRDQWILGPLLPTLRVIAIYWLIASSIGLVWFYIWLFQPQPGGGRNYQDWGSSRMEAVSFVVSQLIQLLKHPFWLLIFIGFAFLVLERTLLVASRTKRLTVRDMWFVIVPQVILQVMDYGIVYLVDALRWVIDRKFPPATSLQIDTGRWHFLPIVEDVAGFVIYVFGALWLFRFYLRRDLPKFGESFPATE